MSSQLKIKEGDVMPAFSLPDEEGQMVDLSRYLGRKPVVLFFYPRDSSFGCTREACAFRDHYSDFQQAGAEVFGISLDGPEEHKRFVREQHLPYRLLSDTDGSIHSMLGIGKILGIIRRRITIIADATGKVVRIYESELQFRKHATEALKALGLGA